MADRASRRTVVAGRDRSTAEGAVSFEVFVQCFEGGEPAGVSRIAIRSLFPVVEAESEPDYWSVRYDDFNSCKVSVTRWRQTRR
jgi:hypothetical protein